MKYYFIGAIVLMFLIAGCTLNSQTEKVNVPNLDEDIFSGNYICVVDWSNSNTLSQGERNYVTNWVEGLWRVDAIQSKELQECIDTQANAKCYLLHAMYNNQPELCENFDEEYTIDSFSPPSMGSGAGGGIEQVECRYREICSSFVKIFNEK